MLAVPLVAAANYGYRLLAVVVSLETDTDVPDETVAQDVLVPSVVRYLPELLVWLGAKALNAVLAVVCPVPPLAIPSVPASVIAPVVAVDGVKPLSDVWNDNTGAEVALDANSLTVPAAFLKYSFSSWMLSANSPLTRFVFTGTADAVVL